MQRPDSSTHSSGIRGIWAAIATVFRENWAACLCLNVLVASLVASYYLFPQVALVWRAVGEFKARWSLPFAAASGATSAALLPWLLQRAMGRIPAGAGLHRLGWQALFWAYRGIEVDFFYRFQGWMFGQGHDVRTLAVKVFVDQFVYSVIWAAPSYVILLRWLDMGCSWPRTRASMDRRFWLHTCPTVIVTNWLVWVPAVCLVYSLPGPLQFPLFTVVMCFFILIVTLLTSGPKEPEPLLVEPAAM